MRKHAFALAAAGAALVFAATGGAALASVDAYVEKYCQLGCDDPAAERAAAEQTWSALDAAGTTSYLGWEADGRVLDEASLIAGARSMGVSSFDTYLRTGAAPGGDGAEIEAAQARIDAVSGTDVSEVAGTRTSTTGVPAGQAATGAAGAAYCNPKVANMQVAAAEAHVDDQIALANSDMGYSALGDNSFANLTCLERLMNSGGDIFFSPPTIGDLLGMLEDFVCDKAEAVYAQATAPLNQSITSTADLGGFYPGLNLGQLGSGVNMRVRPGMGNAGQINVRGLPGDAVGTIVPGAPVELPQGSSLSELYE